MENSSKIQELQHNTVYASTYNKNMIVTEISEVYVLFKGSPVLRGIFVTFC